MKSAVLTIVLSAMSMPLAAQWLDYPTPGIPRTADGKPDLAAPAPRTADGKPDFTGLWAKSAGSAPTSFKPINPTVVDPLVNERNENFGKENPRARCLPVGPGYLTARSPDLNFGMVKVIQTPNVIVMLNPDLSYRQIYMDGRALEAEPNPSWMGYSVGRWEGDTLVVESSGFNDQSWLDGFYPHTEGLRAIERYRRPAFGRLTIEVELHDSALYTEPWKVLIDGRFAADTEMLEYVCNENQTFHEHWVGTQSDAAEAEIAIAADTLAKYAGTYIELPPFWQHAPVARTFEIRFAEGALFLGAQRLSPQSETVFINRGLGIEFVLDERGVPTHLWDKHVSGDYRFDRAE